MVREFIEEYISLSKRANQCNRTVACPVAQMVQTLPAVQRPGFDPWTGRIPWRRAWQPHSSILAWRIPWTEEPGGLWSMGS